MNAIDYEKYRKDVEHYNILLKEQHKADKALADDIVNNAAAVEYLDQEHQSLIDTYGEETDAITALSDAADDYRGKSAESWKESVKGAANAAEAIKAVKDYYKGVRDSTEQAVNSVLKGFEHVGKAGDDLRDKQKEIGEDTAKIEKEYAKIFAKFGGTDYASLQKMADQWDSLTDAEKDAYNALAKIKNEQKEVNDALNQYKPEGMKKNLQDQIAYMEEYLNNLNQLKSWGVSDEMIASLSDGSKESAEFLNGLVEGGPEAAKSVGELYDKVAVEKQNFTDALTANKLSVDETFDGIVEKAKSAMNSLNLGDDAKNAMAATVLGIAQGISDNVPSVSAAVDSLISALDPLGNLGFDWGFKSGSFFLNLFNPIDGYHESGLDRVPFDGYLASLHEGEGILNAEENRIWQRFKAGQGKQSLDYDAIGGVVRDNVHSGGNVYLDGKSVGRVISDIQGNQYRALQRSGWQQ